MFSLSYKHFLICIGNFHICYCTALFLRVFQVTAPLNIKNLVRVLICIDVNLIQCLNRRLNTIENHMGATEAALYSLRKYERGR